MLAGSKTEHLSTNSHKKKEGKTSMECCEAYKKFDLVTRSEEMWLHLHNVGYIFFEGFHTIRPIIFHS